MWQFFSAVLEHAGFTSLLYVITLIGGFFIVRALWRRIREAEKQAAEVDARIEKVRLEEHEKRSAMRRAIDAEKAELEKKLTIERQDVVDEFNRQILELAEIRRSEVERYANRLDAIQEKRVAEAGAIVEKVVRHVESTKNGLEKLNTGLDVMIELTKKV